MAGTQDRPEEASASDIVPFECDVITIGDQVVVTVRGDLDYSTAPAVRREVFAALEPPVQAIEIDLGGLSFMDSSGLGVLNQIRVATRDHDVQLSLASVNPRERRMLELTNMIGIFDVSDPKKRPVSWPVPRPAHFSILVIPLRADVHVQLSGTLDIESTEAFDDCMNTLLAEHPRRLVLDLLAVNAIDEEGVASFTRARSNAKEHGTDFVLDGPNDHVLHALEAGATGTQFVVRRN